RSVTDNAGRGSMMIPFVAACGLAKVPLINFLIPPRRFFHVLDYFLAPPEANRIISELIFLEGVGNPSMLRVLGSTKTLCDGLSRRDMLWSGGLGLFGLGLDEFFRLQEAQAAAPARPAVHAGFGRAKACILLYL